MTTNTLIFIGIFWIVLLMVLPIIISWVCRKLMFKPSSEKLVHSIVYLFVSGYFFTLNVLDNAFIILNAIAFVFLVGFIKNLNEYNSYKTIERKFLNNLQHVVDYIRNSNSYSTYDIAKILKVDEKYAQNGTIGDIENYYRNQDIFKY